MGGPVKKKWGGGKCQRKSTKAGKRLKGIVTIPNYQGPIPQ